MMVRSKSTSRKTSKSSSRKRKTPAAKPKSRKKRSSLNPIKFAKSANSEEDYNDIALLEAEDTLEQRLFPRAYKYLSTHLDNYESTHGKWIEGSLFVLNIFAIVLFILSTHALRDPLARIVFWVEVAVVLVFAVEYCARMWVSRQKVAHFFNPYSLIDLLSIVPILVNFANLSFFRIFRILRLFRLIRILRFQRMFKSHHTLFGKLSKTDLIIVRIVLTVFTIIFVFSGLIWSIESSINPGYGTIWHAIYFAIVTLSTVGFGDITPLSPLGKAVTVIMILTGIALIPWQLGKLVKVVVQTASKEKRVCSNCGLEHHELDAVHCKRCGRKLPESLIDPVSISDVSRR